MNMYTQNKIAWPVVNIRPTTCINTSYVNKQLEFPIVKKTKMFNIETQCNQQLQDEIDTIDNIYNFTVALKFVDNESTITKVNTKYKEKSIMLKMKDIVDNWCSE